ncbi:39S ribosomal protein L38, mitochondrial [Homalodisca vitripennis]|nr:39S ribosomal protein L38, mitochondrial [Homalodisca vitripennis]
MFSLLFEALLVYNFFFLFLFLQYVIHISKTSYDLFFTKFSFSTVIYLKLMFNLNDKITKLALFVIFFRYMDRYRDPKQIAKEYLLKKLKNSHPFKDPKPSLKYPNAVPVYHDLNERLHGGIPSWLKREKIKERLGHGRINDY